MLYFHITILYNLLIHGLCPFFRRQKEMKTSGIERIKEMLLSRLCAVYAFLEKMRAARKLPKCFHVNSAANGIIETVWKAGGNIEVTWIFIVSSSPIHSCTCSDKLMFLLDLFHWSSWVCPSCRNCEVRCLSISIYYPELVQVLSQEQFYPVYSSSCAMFEFASWKHVTLLLHCKYY